MAKLTIGQKAERVLGLLMGLGNPRVAAALAAHGFTVSDLEEGWQRLRAVSHARLGVRAIARDPRIIDELDRFENTWFPIAGYTLNRHHPEANEFLFRNLSQTSGPEVVVSVQVFLERMRALVGGQSELGEDGMRVGEILGKRGLTPQVMAEAQGLLDRLAAIQSEPAVPPPTPEEQEAAENALWGWYLEWSGIARIAILLALGVSDTHCSDCLTTPDAASEPPPDVGAIRDQKGRSSLRFLSRRSARTAA